MPSTDLAPGRARAAGCALLAAAAAACWVPDRPPRLGADLPGAATAWLAPDTSRTVPVAEGVWYRYLWSSRGPWAVHLLEVDLDRCALTLDVARARSAVDEGGGHETVSAMVRRHPGRVLAAVNGDFFTPEGTPLGPEMSRNRPTHGGTRPGLAFRDGTPPAVAVLTVTPQGLEGTGWPPRPDAEHETVGGFPELLDHGARVGDLEVGARPAFAASRHPRTAVGHDPVRNRLWLVVVDGRQGAFSTGMTLPELADLLARLGATEALNLDGGGSSAMVVGERLVSHPSDEAGERPVVNALVVREDRGLCRLR